MYDMYVRKSTEPDDRQALSIPAQLREIRLSFPNLKIGSVIEESFSAKAPGRPQFKELLRRLKTGASHGILAWHPDRLSRNSVDTGEIIYLLDNGRLKDLRFCSYTFENSPEGKWMLSIVMSQAKYQVDKLSIDVNRGNRQKYQSGGITWYTPQGYLNNKANGLAEPDPGRFDVVRKMWDLLFSRAYTVPQIARKASAEWGYRTRPNKKGGERPIAVSSLYKMFRNPFYCGLNVRPDGSVYECTHPPMISVDEFWEAQKILGKKGRTKPRRPEIAAYTDRLIRCGECGCSFTIERKRKLLKSGKVLHFTYYRCSKKRGPCSQAYVPVLTLEDQMALTIEKVALKDNSFAWFLKRLRLLSQQEAVKERSVIDSQVRTVESVSKELSNLSVMRRKEQIEEDEFIAQRAQLLAERQHLVAPQKSAEKRWLAPAVKAVEFAHRSLFWFLNGDSFDKKTILLTLSGSHLEIFDKRLSFQPVEPFALFLTAGDESTWYGIANNIRTYFANENNPREFPELKPIPSEAVDGAAGDQVTDESRKDEAA